MLTCDDYLKYNFATTQDLAKQFITVVSGVLVFSLTFAEKVVPLGSATVVENDFLHGRGH
ncbi:MAG: hypothetical protein IAI50_05730 [Candidatus Eremiobacteraeota bacterium]|nr:hypothetical protein [Candidatus Eremiobacteraeota bacterium]